MTDDIIAFKLKSLVINLPFTNLNQRWCLVNEGNIILIVAFFRHALKLEICLLMVLDVVSPLIADLYFNDMIFIAIHFSWVHIRNFYHMEGTS